MSTAQITLTDEQTERLQQLAASTGRSEQDLLAEAIDRLLIDRATERRREALRRSAGIWKDRDDIPALMEQLRAELDRF